jgi:hypothetical protein
VENLASHRDSVPEPSSPLPVAIPKAIPRPTTSARRSTCILNFANSESFKNEIETFLESAEERSDALVSQRKHGVSGKERAKQTDLLIEDFDKGL